MAQLVEVLAQLRSALVIHRDIKPDNILLDTLGNITLADLGMSRRFVKGEMLTERPSSLGPFAENESKAATSYLTETGCGTLAYAAPEMHRYEPYSFQADVYSVGVILHEMLFGQAPYTSSEVRERFHREPYLEWRIPATCKYIDPNVADLCMKLLTMMPADRIDIDGLRSHAFFKGVDWLTLSARAYDLPKDYAPPLRPIDDTELLNAAIFVDSKATEEVHDMKHKLDEAYSSQEISRFASRPGDPRNWRCRAKNALANLKDDIRSFHRSVSSESDRARRRSWAKDVKHIIGRRLVKIDHRAEMLATKMKKEKEKESAPLQFYVPSAHISSFHCSVTSIVALFSREHKGSPAILQESASHPGINVPAASLLFKTDNEDIASHAPELIWGTERPRIFRRATVHSHLELTSAKLLPPVASGPSHQDLSPAPSNAATCGSPDSENRWLSEAEAMDNNTQTQENKDERNESRRGHMSPHFQLHPILRVETSDLPIASTSPSLRSDVDTSADMDMESRIERFLTPISTPLERSPVPSHICSSSDASGIKSQKSSFPFLEPSWCLTSLTSARPPISSRRSSALRTSRTSFFPLPSLATYSVTTIASTLGALTPLRGSSVSSNDATQAKGSGRKCRKGEDATVAGLPVLRTPSEEAWEKNDGYPMNLHTRMDIFSEERLPGHTSEEFLHAKQRASSYRGTNGRPFTMHL